MFVCVVHSKTLPDALVLAQGHKQQCLLAALAYMGQHDYGTWRALANTPDRHVWDNGLYGDEITITNS